MIKELAEEFERKLTCLEKKLKNPWSFQFKKLQELIKNKNKLQKQYLTDYNLLIVQDLQQGHYQILFVILLNEFIKLNTKMNMVIENAQCVELNTGITTVFLNALTEKMI